MNNIEYGGIYWADNIYNIGNIYIRFFRNNILAYAINSKVANKDEIFNSLQKNYNSKIDITQYSINNNRIEFKISSEMGEIQLSGELTEAGIIISIVYTIKKERIENKKLFSYYKKIYSYNNSKTQTNYKRRFSNDNGKTQTNIVESKMANVDLIFCENCRETKFENHLIYEEKTKAITFTCMNCRSIYVFRNNSIDTIKTQTNILGSKIPRVDLIVCENCRETKFENHLIYGKKTKVIVFICIKCHTKYVFKNNSIRAVKDYDTNNTENIPGTPQMAHSLNGVSYRSIAKWGNKIN